MWSADGWAEVLDVFCKHLSYMPVVGPGVRVTAHRKAALRSDGLMFTAADVFATDYRATKLDRVWFTSGHWWRRAKSTPSNNCCCGGLASSQMNRKRIPDMDDDNDDRNSEEVVDSGQNAFANNPAKRCEAVTERNRRRLARIRGSDRSRDDELRVPRGTQPGLSRHGPEGGIGAVWRRDSEKAGWSANGSSELTHGIWSSLFFARASGEEGWLEFPLRERGGRQRRLRSEHGVRRVLGRAYRMVPGRADT